MRHGATPIADFDPNKKPSDPFATYIPRRSPEFKLHTKLSNAMNALSNHKCGAVFEWKGGRWARITYLGEPETGKRCDQCGGPPSVTRQVGNGQWARTVTSWGRWRFEREQTGRYRSKIVKPYKPEYVCYNCNSF